VASPASAHGREHGHEPATTVFTETNAAAGNEVIAYRNVAGALTEVGRYSTGGTGSGDGLGHKVQSQRRTIACSR
jgi:hypothetical protein